MQAGSNQKDIIWDRLTRAIHWSIAIIVILNLFVLEEGDPPHRYLGYAAVAFVFLRILHGFRSQGFSSFKKLPLRFRELFQFLKAKISRKPTVIYEGHNPAASWVYIGIWILIVLLGVTGFMMGLDAYWGEDWLKEIHESISDALQILILAHFAGIIADSIQMKRKTWLGMLTGRR